MRNWISILTVITFLGGVAINNSVEEPANKLVKELPVMKVNVYMMGREEVDEQITIKIFENIEYLNQAFEGEISFVFDELFMDPNHAYLPDIYEGFKEGKDAMVEPLVSPIEKTGGINIYLFDTYAESGQSAALMGFTPLLRAKQNTYATNSPRFDRILMAYEGLEENKTLVHEMGHFFGLKHPWEISTFAKHKLGMKNDTDEAKNHMSYGSEVEKFTPQQLDEMRNYALKYRKYLMDRVVKVYAGV